MTFSSKLFSIETIFKVFKYSFLGFFNNVKFIALSIINIFKVIPVRKNYRIYPYETTLYYFYDIFFYYLKKLGDINIQIILI